MTHGGGDLPCLVRIASMLNSTLDLPELLQNIMAMSEEVMNAQASSLMLIDEKSGDLTFEISRGEKGEQIKELFRLEPGKGIAGWVAKHGEGALVPDAAKDPRFFSGPDRAVGFVTRSVVCVPLQVKGKTIGVLQVLNPREKPRFDETDLELLHALSDSAAVAIENARMVRILMEKQRVEQELQIARQIQDQLLIRNFPETPGLRLFATSLAALEVGGDFYDAVELERGAVALFIGDVSGKSIPAAMYMVKILTDFRSLVQGEGDPAAVMQQLNERLCQSSTRGMFARLFSACVTVPGTR